MSMLKCQPCHGFHLQYVPRYTCDFPEVSGLFHEYTVPPRPPETFLYYFKVSWLPSRHCPSDQWEWEKQIPNHVVKLGASVAVELLSSLTLDSYEEAGVQVTPVSSPVPVVFQGSLHLEDFRTTLQPGRQLEFLVQIWFLLQNLWGWGTLPQQELQQPTVSLDFC